MQVVDGNWIMDGVEWDDPSCVHSAEELLTIIDKVGFLPLFSNEIAGFSVESRTDPSLWWAGDSVRDPWEWRVALSRTGNVAYGKFFGNKAGYVSKKWFPYLANFRRDGYDFDARYDDGLAKYREKLIMDLFIPNGMDIDKVKKNELAKHGCAEVLFTNEMKEKAGFGKCGEKGFDGVLAKLQMQTYLVTKDFQQRLNKSGESFGWAIAMMTTPEYLWGYDFVTKCYAEKPEESYQKIVAQIQKHFDAEEKTIRKVLGR